MTTAEQDVPAPATAPTSPEQTAKAQREASGKAHKELEDAIKWCAENKEQSPAAFLVAKRLRWFLERADEDGHIFPDIGSSAGGHHMEQEKMVIWFPLNVKVLDYDGAKQFLASQAFVLWQIYSQLAARLKQMQATNVPPPKKGLFGIGK